MESSGGEDDPFEDLPPRERIELILKFIQSQKNVMEVQRGMYTSEALDEWERSFWSDITEKIMGAINEQPSLARESFAVPESHRYGYTSRTNGPEMPLMHLLCHLNCGLPLVEAVHNVAGPESLMVIHSQYGREFLPLHMACFKGSASVELIDFLVKNCPESETVRSGDELPLQMALPHRDPTMREDPFDENERRLVLFRLLSESLSREELIDATREVKLSWNESSTFPLGLIQEVARLHECKSLFIRTDTVTWGCDIEVQGDVLICRLKCDRCYDFALEQLLLLPLPIKELEANDMDDPNVIFYFTNAIDPPQNDDTEDFTDMAAMFSFSLPIQPRPPPPPLDLSSVEKVCINTIIKDEETMMNLMKGLRHLPNLRELSLRGFWNSCEGYGVYPLTESCLGELATVANKFKSLKIINLDNVDQSTSLPFADFLLEYQLLERVTFTADETLEPSQVEKLARFLRSSKTIKYLKLGALKDGVDYIVNAIKDNGSVLEEFVGEGEWYGARRLDFDTSPIETCLTINRIVHQLSGTSMNMEKAYAVYQPYLQDTPVLYALLRCRPELWCNP